MATILGNDLSQFEGDVNYDTYKNNSNFVIVKTTEGIGYIDPKFKRNQSEARRVGLALGYYHFARPDLFNKPESEADYFLNVCGQLKSGEVLALDYECANQKQADVDWCKRFLDRIKTRNNTRAFIYLNEGQVKRFNWQQVVDGDYALWIAKYTYDPKNSNYTTGAWKSAAMHQWTDKQTVPGVGGAVDGNVFYGDLLAFKKYGFQVAPLPPQPDYKVLYEKAQDKINRIHAICEE